MDDKISLEALRRMPPGQPLRVETTPDMDGVEQRAVVWLWTDRSHEALDVRKSYFRLSDGGYLGDL